MLNTKTGDVKNGWAAVELPKLQHRGQYSYRLRDNHANDRKYGLFIKDDANDDVFNVTGLIIDYDYDNDSDASEKEPQPFIDVYTQLYKMKFSGEEIISLHRDDVIIIRCIYVVYKKYLPDVKSRAGIDYLFWMTNPASLEDPWEPDFLGSYDHPDYVYINEVGVPFYVIYILDCGIFI